MNRKHFLLGFFVGGITVSACTLLAAPASGKETRQVLADQTKVWMSHLSEIKESLHDLSESIKTASLESTDPIKSFVSDLKIALTDWEKKIEPHQEDLKKELNAIELSIRTLESQIKRHKHTNTENSTE
ncbi:YtxH domain-containing protein [Bacillus benzoevorans]|uniref:Gas vesicle protein n=1 Tax=Bacillus benzoevorans TaxID=1456 RepID=A0A7X0LT26_9BACI|nr:YtxH domain-containing protein [Bacillus benzoevorans]MBB6443471.1 gas vesicle protein [Bacillus benzoevorans]